jgi:hypothetical protein
MKIYDLKRGQGKTTRLVILSEYTKRPILCASQEHHKVIKDIAHQLNAKIPEPITISELSRLNGTDRTVGTYFIDETPQFLTALIASITGGVLTAPLAITLSEDNSQ